MTLATTGNRRCLVSIERATDTPQGNGEVVRTWAQVQTAWAAIDSLAGGEYYLEGELQASCPVKIMMRAFPSFTLSVKTHRINYGGRIFEIVDVRNVQERGAFWDIYCKEAAR